MNEQEHMYQTNTGALEMHFVRYGEHLQCEVLWTVNEIVQRMSVCHGSTAVWKRETTLRGKIGLCICGCKVWRISSKHKRWLTRHRHTQEINISKFLWSFFWRFLPPSLISSFSFFFCSSFTFTAFSLGSWSSISVLHPTRAPSQVTLGPWVLLASSNLLAISSRPKPNHMSHFQLSKGVHTQHALKDLGRQTLISCLRIQR